MWGGRYANGLKLADENNPGRLDEFPITRDLGLKNGYSGYTMQQYITKSKGGERRPTKAYDEIISKVPAEVHESLGSYFTENLNIGNAHLGDLPHLFSLVPLAQSVAAPILELQSVDGLVGSQYKQRTDFGEILGLIATNLANNILLD